MRSGQIINPDKAYLRGVKAGKSGRPMYCPYTMAELRKAWISGFQAGFMARPAMNEHLDNQAGAGSAMEGNQNG